MAHLRPRYKTVDGKKRVSGYHAEFYDPLRHPQRKYVTLRTRDKRVAQARLVDYERQYSRGEWDPWRDASPEPGLLVEAAKKRYLASRKNRRPKTLRLDETAINRLINLLPPGAMLQHVETRHVEQAVTHNFKSPRKPLSASSQSSYLTRLRTFMDWCVGEGMIKVNPAASVPKPKVGKRPPEYLTRDDYERLLSAIEADAVMKAAGIVDGERSKHTTLKEGEVRWLADVVRFAVGTGLRLGEICHLRWSAVNLATKFVTVANTKEFRTKSGHERSIPVTGAALDVLARKHEERAGEGDSYVFTGVGGAKLDEVYTSKRFKKYARLAKLPERIRFHSLRHTYASWLVMAGVDLFVVKELLGHESIETTQRYAHLAPQNLVASVALGHG